MNAAAKVGAFFLVTIILGAVLVFKIEDLHFGKKGGKTVKIAFSDVSGLDNKSAVRVAGVRVGKVTKIQQVEGRAFVDVQLDEDVDLRQGASAAIANMGLLGEKYVELVPGPVGGAELPDDAIITGNQPVTFDQVTKLARDIELDVKDITSSLRSAVGGPEGEQTTKAIVANIERITEELKVIAATNHQNVDETLANLREFSEVITRLADRVDSLVAENSAHTSESITNIKEISDKLQHTADNLNSITDKINVGQGTVGQLINSGETSKNINDALVSVKEGVDSLSKTLTKVNRLKIDLGMRAEYLTSPAKGKGYVTLDLKPADDHFYRIEASTQPFGLRTDTTTDYTITGPDGKSYTTTVFKEEFKDTISLSAYAGFNFGNLALRAGLEESTGGGGIDYSLLNKRILLSADMFDFSRTGYNPHGKIGGRFYLTPGAFVSAGWDDFLNRSKKADSVFLGGGFRWSDDDIKLLLSAVPVR